MKLGLKDKIQAQIDAYKANSKTQGEAIMAVLEPFKTPSYANQFTQEGLRKNIKDKIDEINADWKMYDVTLNQNVNAAVDEARKSLMNALHMKDDKKPADYSIRIATALEFLKVELDTTHKNEKELDAAIFMILKDFIDDYDTMKLFSKMVEKKVFLIGASGECSLPATFGKTMKVDSIMNALREIEMCAENLFVSRIGDSYVTRRHDVEEVIRIKGDSYGIPFDGVSEMTDEINIINNVIILDDLADKIDEDGHFTFTGEGQKVIEA